MMLGENSSGRKVSLLNEASSPPLHHHHNTFTRPNLPDRSRISPSSSSSCMSRDGGNSSRSSFSDSDPKQSPPTPPLSRLDSSSSIATKSTPSPMTPSYGFEPMDPNSKSNALPYYHNYNRASTNGHAYPSMQDPTPQPYYNLSSQQVLPRMTDFDLDDAYNQQRTTLQPLQTQLSNTYSTDTISQMSPQTIASTSTTASLPPISSAPSIKTDPTTPITTSAAAPSSNKTPVAKKKYPCPHKDRFGCTDQFTTSGHAARHGKKHTGEKNILCPTCNKAFTRKDNMKQHERTHKGASRAGSTASSPAVSVKGESRRASFTATSGDAMQVDCEPQQKPQRPKMQRSELSEIIEGIDGGVGRYQDDIDADGEGESPGLDALATAASEMI